MFSAAGEILLLNSRTLCISAAKAPAKQYALPRISYLDWNGALPSLWSGLVWDESSRVQVEPQPQTPLDLHDFKARSSVSGSGTRVITVGYSLQKYTHPLTSSG